MSESTFTLGCLDALIAIGLILLLYGLFRFLLRVVKNELKGESTPKGPSSTT